jgi:hypothetical protein
MEHCKRKVTSPAPLLHLSSSPPFGELGNEYVSHVINVTTVTIFVKPTFFIERKID